MRKGLKAALLFVPLLMLLFSQCKHEPIFPDGFTPDGDTSIIPPIDTNNPPDPPDTTDPGTPCEPGVIYFEKDVLPIFGSSCAVPGCHNAPNGQDGVVLDSYANVMRSGEVDPGDPESSDVYENLVEDDEDKRMPPPGSGITLTQQQINTIRNWIAQGAQNLTCDENSGGCDSTGVSFSAVVMPIITNNCRGCHSGTSPQKGVDLTTHGNIMVVVNDGRLLRVITHSPGITPMPLNQPKMDDCKIAQISNWINAGAPNN